MMKQKFSTVGMNIYVKMRPIKVVFGKTYCFWFPGRIAFAAQWLGKTMHVRFCWLKLKSFSLLGIVCEPAD